MKAEPGTETHRVLQLGAPAKVVFILLAALALLRVMVLDVPLAWARSSSGGSPNDYPCVAECPGSCPPGQDAESCSECSSSSEPLAVGMPIWRVSEPFMSLWLEDAPMSYQPSRGQRQEFRLLYKSDPDSKLRAEVDSNEVFSFGRDWFTPMKKFLKKNDDGSYEFFNGLGGTITVSVGGSQDYRSRLRCSLDASGNPVLTYPSGKTETYGWSFDRAGGAVKLRFLTEQKDRQANTTKYIYSVLNGAAVLDRIEDVDGKATVLSYTNVNGFQMVAKVTSPYGQSTILHYENTGMGAAENLITIVDAGRLTNSFTYDNQVLTSMVTPYGTTSFKVFQDGVYIRENGLRDHLYAYLELDASSRLPLSYSSVVPATTPFSNTFDTEDSNKRNSFYWTPKSFGSLPGIFRENVTNGWALDLAQLTNSDFANARQRHWLQSTNILSASAKLGQTLSFQRAASPDGVVAGPITWYDYEGKTSGDRTVEGTFNLPRFIGWKLPDGNSRFVRYARNALGKPTQQIETYTDVSGSTKLRTNVLVYAGNNIDVLSITNAAGVRTLHNLYDHNGFVTNSLNALNEATSFLYDANRRLIRVRTPAGLTTTNVYGTDGFLAKTINLEVGRTNSYTWLNAMVRTHTDERGLTATHSWDGLNRLLTSVYGDGRGLTNAYDKLDLAVTVDRMGATNRYYYNAFRQPIQVIDALNRTNLYQYCDCGSLESDRNPAGETTTYAYDNVGRLTSVAFPDNTWQARRYTALGLLTNIIDSAGTSITNWYNNQGLLTEVRTAAGLVSKTQYDIEDQAVSHSGSAGVTVSYTFDKLGRVLTRTQPDTGKEQFGYTPNVAGVTSFTNAIANVYLHQYDPRGLVTNQAYVGVATNVYTYRPGGELETFRDSRGMPTTWLYDEFGRVKSKVDASGTTNFTYQYDFNGRLTNRVSAAKGERIYRYDRVGNLTNASYASGPGLSFRYDALNRLTNMVDGIGTTTFTYNNSGRLATEDGPWASDTVAYAYNQRLPQSLSVAAPSGAPWNVTYGFDAAKRLTNVTSAAGSFGYLYAASRPVLPAQVNLPGGAYITNYYDAVGRLASTTLKSGQGVILNAHGYGYDLANQRTQQVFTAGNFVNYSYDKMGQLVRAYGYDPGSIARSSELWDYGYDPAGNLLGRTNNAFWEKFQVDAANGLTNITRSASGLTVSGRTSATATNVTVNGLAATRYADRTFARTGFSLVNGSNTFTAIAWDSLGRTDTNVASVKLPAAVSLRYDLNGNLISDGTRAFSYDDENQLVTVLVTNAWRTDFAYDGQMRLRIRFESSWSGSQWVTNQTIRYVYDGKLVIQERSGANTPLVSYTRGRDLSGGAQQAGGIGGLLARTEHGAATPQLATSLYHADGNGNITALLSTNQLVVACYSYDPYGNVIAQTGPLADANVYRFSSKEQHVNSGLVYYGYRFYEPKFQRWLNRDPKGETGGLNIFGFNRRNPVGYVDPFGLSTDDDELDRITSGDVLTPLSPYLPGVPTDQLSEVLCDLGNSLLDPEEWQDALAVVEPVPVVGDLASAMNTAIDMSQGNYSMAVMGVAATFTPLPGPRTFKNAAEGAVTLDANAIRFSQSNVRSTLPELTQSMTANGWSGAPIDVVRMPDGALTAVDNTRLAAASLSKTPVQAVIRGFDEAFPAARAGGNLQGGTWGEAVLNRIGGQKPGWQRVYPNGSPFTGVHPTTPDFHHE